MSHLSWDLWPLENQMLYIALTYTAILVGIFVGVVAIRTAWSLVGALIISFGERLQITHAKYTFSLRMLERSPGITEKFRVDVIRYGSDQYLQEMASEAESKVGRLRNRSLPVRVDFEKKTLSFKLPLHRTLGTQFKLHVVTDNADRTADELGIMEGFYGVESSLGHRPPRVYFLLRGMPVSKTFDGLWNNFAYPK